MQSLRKLFPYYRPYRLRLALGILFIIISNAAFVFVPRQLQIAIDSLKDPESPPLWWYFVGIVGAAGLSAVCRFFIRQTLIVMSRRQEYDLRQDLWQNLQRLSPQYFQQRQVGDIMAHLTNDVESVRMFFGPVTMYSMDYVCRFFMVLALLISYSGWLAFYAMAPLVLLAVAIYFIIPLMHERFTRIQETFSAMSSRTQQNVAGIRVIKSYTREQHESERFDESSKEYFNKQMDLVRVRAAFRPLIYLIPSLSAVVIIWYGGKQVIANPGSDGLTVGQLSAFLYCLVQLVWPMIALGWTFNIAQRASASTKRIMKILEEKPSILDNDETDETIRTLQGDITYNHVQLCYPNMKQPALEDVELSIPAGSTVAIVGRTGSGKTSLVDLLPRFHDATDGEICIDGYPIRKIPLRVLRKHIGYATQEPFLFSVSLRENLAFPRPDADDEAIQQAAEIAQLANDVDQFPQGYDTHVGERGLTLSGGQKQRCALARAILRDPEILILDDAFSAVDTATEEKILRGLREFRRNRTTILISHRVSTVKDADKIFVLDGGRIKERGTHEGLMAAKGIYAEMQRKQQIETELEEI